jgi:hypothetical protein
VRHIESQEMRTLRSSVLMAFCADVLLHVPCCLSVTRERGPNGNRTYPQPRFATIPTFDCCSSTYLFAKSPPNPAGSGHSSSSTRGGGWRFVGSSLQRSRRTMFSEFGLD